MLVGPTGCGKTYFTKNFLAPELYKQIAIAGIDNGISWLKPNIQHISSDALRREVLGNDDLHKHDPRMLYASDAAFKLLFTKLEMAMKWPTNAHFVIIDTTGLSDEFRKQVRELTEENQYHLDLVVFDYNNFDEYLLHTADDKRFNKRITREHLDRLRKMYRNFDSKFSGIHKIKNKSFENIDIKVRNLSYYTSCFLYDQFKYDIISDVHGCYDELTQLLQKLGYELDNNKLKHRDGDRRVILAGDMIDKGPNSHKVLDFITQNINMFYLVNGNHENFIWKYFNNKIPSLPSQEIMDGYFTTHKEGVKFKETLAGVSGFLKPFLRHPNFIVTHAPCENKYLEKLDHKSAVAQRKVKSGLGTSGKKDSIEVLEKELSHVKDEAVSNMPKHVCGHIALAKICRIRNKYMIDTGVADGNKLTSVSFYGHKPVITQVDALNKIDDHGLVRLFAPTRDVTKFNLEIMDPADRARLMSLARNKVNFISGTVSPSASNYEANTLESMETAYDYYRHQDISKVILQPKYMGSRCNLYLFKDIEKCYAVTRNGFVIRYCDMKPVFNKYLTDKPLFDCFESKNKPPVSVIILDGELMPWTVLGQGLVDFQYAAVSKGLETELAFLKEQNFIEKLDQIKALPQWLEYEKERLNMSRKDLAKKYGHLHQIFSCIPHIDINPIDEQIKQAETYKEQIKLYGSPGDLDYKPFSVLKVVYEDGTEKPLVPDHNNITQFDFIGEDPYFVVNIGDEQSEKMGIDFFNRLCFEKKMEGIVMKPEKVYTKGVAPYLKVRNHEYLHLIYGYDFKKTSKYKRLVNGKRIKRKMEASIREFEIGLEMLKIPYNDINMENDKFLQIAANMIAEEKGSVGIDPRL